MKPYPDTPLDAHRKVVLITGASSGIGRAVALLYGAKHSCVALVARRADRLEIVAEQVLRAGGQALVIPTDVSDRNQIETAVHKVEEHWGRLDVLINNAGYGVFGSIEECYPEDFEQQMRVNYLAAVYATKIAIPLMRRQGSGAIINVSSISGKAASPYDAAYCASKFALNAFTSVLQMELAGTGISVSLVCPGYTKTEWLDVVVQRRPYVIRTALSPMSPERVAGQIVSCAERHKREVLIPRILILPVLLQTILPTLYHWWQSRYRRYERHDRKRA